MSERIRGYIYITIFLLSIASLSINVFAQAEQRPIYDERCTRELLLRPNSCYSTGKLHNEDGSVMSGSVSLPPCKREGNSESEIIALDNHCAGSKFEDDFLFGRDGFNFFGTDVKLSKDAIPAIVRMVVTMAAGIFAFSSLVMSVFGYYKWMNETFETQAQEAAYKYFTHMLSGVFYGGATIPLTWLIFYAAGYRGNIFDFDYALDRTLDVDCPAIKEEDVCKKYDLSCNWTSDSCEKVINLEE